MEQPMWGVEITPHKCLILPRNRRYSSWRLCHAPLLFPDAYFSGGAGFSRNSGRLGSFCDRRMGGQPHLHRCQPGRRIRHRPVPCRGRKLRRSRRAFLLPVARFCTGHRLQTRTTRRDDGFDSGIHGLLSAQRLQRIRRDNLSTLNRKPQFANQRKTEVAVRPPHSRLGNDVTLPREADMTRARWRTAIRSNAFGLHHQRLATQSRLPRDCAKITAMGASVFGRQLLFVEQICRIAPGSL